MRSSLFKINRKEVKYIYSAQQWCEGSRSFHQAEHCILFYLSLLSSHHHHQLRTEEEGGGRRPPPIAWSILIFLRFITASLRLLHLSRTVKSQPQPVPLRWFVTTWHIMNISIFCWSISFSSILIAYLSMPCPKL